MEASVRLPVLRMYSHLEPVFKDWVVVPMWLQYPLRTSPHSMDLAESATVTVCL